MNSVPSKVLIILALCLFPLSYKANAAIVYTGSLETPDGIQGTGVWADDFKISWEITFHDDGGDGFWEYVYTLTNTNDEVLSKGVSHLLMETSEAAELSDFWGFEVDEISLPPDKVELKDFSDADPSNPNIPGVLHGLKMDEGGTQFSFFSYKEPVWGDFYSKDGKSRINGVQVDNAVWNTDFNKADPFAPAQSGLLTDKDGNVIYKILRPDTNTGPPPSTESPEPTTMLLFAIGLGSMGFRRRFFRS